jgi:hypothetical protein
MPIGTIEDDESSASARTKINAAIAAANAHVRTSNAIRGNTVAATNTIVTSAYGSGPISHGIMAVINYNGVEVFLYGEDTDTTLDFTPTGNHISLGSWNSSIDSAPSVPSPSTLAAALAGRQGFSVSSDLTFTAVATGPVTAPTITSGTLLTFTSTTVGVDASGAVTEIVLIPGVEGKKIKTTALWVRQTESAISGSLTCDVALLKDGVYTPIVTALDPTTTNATVPNDAYPEPFALGVDEGESLVARFIGATPDGGQIRWIAIAEQS